jgi:hypothetical protein
MTTPRELAEAVSHRLPFAGYFALVALFAAGVFASFALARGGVALTVTLKNVKPGAQARALAKAACTDLRGRVGKVRFTKTFKTVKGCQAIMAGSAQSGIALCKKRYPAGSTADEYCIELAIQSSPVERAAVAGLRITTGKTVTYIPVPTSGPGAGTGVGTGAGTGGGIPGSHG